MELYDSQSSKALDLALTSGDVEGSLLMMRAAEAVWSEIKLSRRICRIFCIVGSGNNGGDALGVACLALIDNQVVEVTKLSTISTGSQPILQLALSIGVPISDKLPLLSEISNGDLIIDGCFGVGLNRKPSGASKAAIDWMNSARGKGVRIISIDVPSGLDATSGTAPGVVVKADATIMCLTRKQGCFTGVGPDVCGKLSFAHLGIVESNSLVNPTANLITREILPKIIRQPTGHKGTHGSVLVLGGWNGMEGAGCLAGLAALKVGAGKVFICGPDFSERSLELIGVRKEIQNFEKVAKKMQAIVAGPGLGDRAYEFLDMVWHLEIPLVLDADSFYWLRRNKPAPRKTKWIATPHLGEAKHLLGKLPNSRFDTIKALNKIYGGCWILKGAGTLVGPEPMFVNPYAESALGTAGSGDVLSGIVGGLLAQGVSSPALCSVWLHSEAARLNIAAKNIRFVASDLISKLGEAINGLS